MPPEEFTPSFEGLLMEVMNVKLEHERLMKEIKERSESYSVGEYERQQAKERLESEKRWWKKNYGVSIKAKAHQRFGNMIKMEELTAMVIQILTTLQNAEAFIYLDRRIFQLMISTRFPFSINENYSEREIIKALGIGAR